MSGVEESKEDAAALDVEESKEDAAGLEAVLAELVALTARQSAVLVSVEASLAESKELVCLYRKRHNVDDLRSEFAGFTDAAAKYLDDETQEEVPVEEASPRAEAVEVEPTTEEEDQPRPSEAPSFEEEYYEEDVAPPPEEEQPPPEDAVPEDTQEEEERRPPQEEVAAEDSVEEKTFVVTFDTVDSLGFSVALMRDRDRQTSHIIVDKVFESCPAKESLRVLDELVALNDDDPIADIESKDSFNEVVEQIRNGPRPVAITFHRLSPRYLLSNSASGDDDAPPEEEEG